MRLFDTVKLNTFCRIRNYRALKAYSHVKEKPGTDY
jgi:hypothetical protein